MASQYDLTIIGGGILGLATALKITAAHPRLRLLLLEKEAELARHQTGNNSGVIHSGLYYRPGSLKARTCVTGRKELMQFCDDNPSRMKFAAKSSLPSVRKNCRASTSCAAAARPTACAGWKSSARSG